MGIFDKLKNALFEEEYVEVEETPKTIKQAPKKIKSKEKEKEDIKEKYRDRDVEIEDDVEEKPIAKKVVLPEKKETFVEPLPETVIDDVTYEDVMVSEEPVPLPSRRQFKMVDDNEFEVENVSSRYQPEVEPQIVKVIEREVLPSRPYQNEKENLYHGRIPNQPYGSIESPKTTVNDYRTYESKIDEKTHFKPSPIISPIYGILDKNYKKEDVVSKREVKITSSFAREKLNLDEIREKAFGNNLEELNDEPKRTSVKPTFEVETTSNLLVDLSSDDSKPTVKDVTVGDAVEYFEDLGLEYNVDYLDASKKASGRRVRDDYNDDDNKQNLASDEPKFVSVKDDSLDDDDNLFDLIDSMYQDEH